MLGLPLRKVRVVMDLIRGKQLSEALNIVRFTPKSGFAGVGETAFISSC